MDVFSNLMVIGECLLDVRRTNAFAKAIRKTVHKGDIVLDVGTGSAILAMLSARSGAKHVYAIDIAPDIVMFAKRNIRNNNLRTKISVERSDAKSFSSKLPIDVLTMELMDTWLVGEQQGVVINTLLDNGTITPDTKLIPYRYQCAFTLIDYDFTFYRNTMPFVIQARNFGVMKRIKHKYSERCIANDIYFSRHVETAVDKTISFTAKETGYINAVVLESRTFLAPGVSVWGTTDMNMPVIIPLKEQQVKTGEELSIRFRYDMGEGFSTFFAELV